MTAMAIRVGRSPLRLTLGVDALIELGGGLVLIVLRDDIAAWWGIPEGVVAALGVAFLLAFVAIGVLVVWPVRVGMVRVLALANVAGGLGAWALFAVCFGRFEPEGRWLLGTLADSFLLVGVAEWLLVRDGGR